jgi:hypothetical protein
MDANTVSSKRKVLNKLRKWSTFLAVAMIVLLVANIYLSYRLIMFNKNSERARHTIDMMEGTIKEMQEMDNKAKDVLRKASDLIRQDEEDLFKSNLAGIIVEYFDDKHVGVKYYDVLKIIECSRKYAVEPFTYVDMLTLAWVESNYDPKCVGTHGEQGVWQILAWKDYLKQLKAKNPQDIETNCKMATMELGEKYKWKGNFRDSIIAYNGWVVKDGTVMQTYYDNFSKKRKVVEQWCKKAEKRSRKFF